MKLPTVLGKQLLGDWAQARCLNEADAYLAVAAFQRMALTTDYETAIEAIKPWFKPQHRRIADKDQELLKAVYNITKPDLLGHAIDSIAEAMNNKTGPLKDKVAAATIINDLYGEKEIIKDAKLSDRLLISLTGGK